MTNILRTNICCCLFFFVVFFVGGRGGVFKQVALHRSLTSLLHVAEMRPVNWRRYCATSWSPSRTHRIEGGTEARTATSVEQQQRSSGEGDALLEQFGSLPPVCVLFALCENGSGRGGGASELQPLIWQLLELTLRPEDNHPAVVGVGVEAAPQPLPLPVPPSALGSLLRKSGSGDGGGSVVVDSTGAPGTHEGEGGCSPAGASVVVDGGAGVRAGGPIEAPAAAGEERQEEEDVPRLPSSYSVGAPQSPAELLMLKGLVGSDALVEMAQDLLSPAASAEARKRTSRVLHHLWVASAPDSRLEVRKGKAWLEVSFCLKEAMASRQGSEGGTGFEGLGRRTCEMYLLFLFLRLRMCVCLPEENGLWCTRRTGCQVLLGLSNLSCWEIACRNRPNHIWASRTNGQRPERSRAVLSRSRVLFFQSRASLSCPIVTYVPGRG